jgi:transglutaminase-like putative cysteine protease
VAAPIVVPSGVPAAALEADPLLAELYDYAHATPYVPLDDRVRALAAELDAGTDDLAEYVLAAGRFVYRAFAYRPGSTTVRTKLAEVIETRSGVCQDFAHVLLALLRLRGIPARYASGYIYDGSGSVLGAEASHAWVEAYLPPFGWVGYDPTNDRLVDDSFVLVAHGRDYADVSPTRGVYRGGPHGTLDVTVAIDAPDQ